LNAQTPARGLLPAALAAVLAVLMSIAPAASAQAPDGVTATAPAAQVGLKGAGKSSRVRHGGRVAVSGFVEPRGAGHTVVLERAFLGRGYRDIARAVTRSDGSYRFTLEARRSAAYRVVTQPPVAVADTASAVRSRARRVVVVARIAGRASRHVLAGRRVRISGRMRPGLRGRAIRVQLRTASGWRTVDRTRTRRGGKFRGLWRPSGIGRYSLRVRFAGDGVAAGARDRLSRVHVYRSTFASWYGPGLYGNSTACGGALTPWRLGVAHKSLPCGTKVTFRYRGRSVTVPVIDRGPYVSGREWDLTAATKAALGFGSTGIVLSTR
jgi:rare lipoprotein A